MYLKKMFIKIRGGQGGKKPAIDEQQGKQRATEGNCRCAVVPLRLYTIVPFIFLILLSLSEFFREVNKQ